MLNVKFNFCIHSFKNHIQEKILPIENNNYWNEMLDEMKSNSPKGNILIIYVPTVPRVLHNQLDFYDEYKQIAIDFQKACLKNHVGFINLEDEELRYYQETRRFCRGFPMSRPGVGHCNTDGHRMMAQAIDGYINQCNLLK